MKENHADRNGAETPGSGQVPAEGTNESDGSSEAGSRWGMIAVIATVSAGILLFGAFLYLFGELGNPHAEGEFTLEVPSGATVWWIANRLEEEGVIHSPRRFVYHVVVRGLSSRLRAGVYRIERSAPMREIASQLARGSEITLRVTIPEGARTHQIAGRLQREAVCDSSAFMEAVEDTVLVEKLGFPSLKSLEGVLFPETYLFRMQRPADQIVETLANTFRERMGQEWLDSARRHELGLSGILTLASIVQGEIMQEGEAGDVAALYHNRLARGMKLQADPTIQYLIQDGPRRLLLKDLEIDSPYNTYRYKGIPPGPINNPGHAALEAALYPPAREWLYMVADGEGGHIFTTNWNDHLEAKAAFDRIRRRVAREERAKGLGQ